MVVGPLLGPGAEEEKVQLGRKPQGPQAIRRYSSKETPISKKGRPSE